MDGLQYSIPPVFFFIAFIFLLIADSNCAELDTISANQPIKDGNTIISNGDMYELGFFSPGKSNNRYLGIWYKKISYGTVVWVANRETPITDTFGMFKVSKNGTLLILNGNNTQIWSSNSTVSAVNNHNPVAQLLDTGNLVVWDENRNMIWQSFDYPGDTFLPGMDTAGSKRFMTSWKSPGDPSIGEYNTIVDTNGYPQIFARKGPVILHRLGPWNGVGFSGFATEIPNPVFSDEFIIFNQKEIHHSYKLTSSVVQRRVITWDGKLLILNWIERIRDWIVYIDAGVDSCGRYAPCGSYGSCSMNKRPACSCMKGFEPKNQDQWDASDWSSGCQHKRSFDCGETDGFMKISGVKFPDTRFSSYNVSMTLGECEIACKRDCKCTAYANLDIRNGGSGCLMWFGELMDMREYDEDQNIFIRMAASELAGYESDSNKRKLVLIVVLTISSALLILCAVIYVCGKRNKRFQGGREYALNKKKNTSVQREHLDDTPFFSLDKVVKATYNFNDSNKIGEGGFGPVYKGVLDDGREIAVKRLSETSQQGIDEFINELSSIAKFQHRNLVKLHGYCIHGNEMILIYEYMANKSLDLFLFDETRSLELDWPRRFVIIHGIARGILYLHQDSRLQIIHRDLKAGNILLDSDMNPKISDFGLARKFVGHDNFAKTKKVVGTYGYISPEYALHGRYSIKSDVFSFGVLVLEIVSGKKNREFSNEDQDNLLGYAWRLYKEDRSMELVCDSLRASYVVTEVIRSIHVALLCVQHHAGDRPTMLSVLLMLVSESALPQPKHPAFFNQESNHKIESISLVNDESIITGLYPQ